MQRRWGILGFIVAVTACAASLTGCSPAAADLAMDGGVRCVDSAETGEAYAAFSITNTGGPARLLALDIGSTDGLEVQDAWIMPLVHGAGLDIATGPIDIPNWGEWTDAVGSPLPADETVQLVLRLRTLDPAADAFLTGVTIYAGGSEVSVADAVVGLTPGGACPADGELPSASPLDGGGLVLGSGIGSICAASEGAATGRTFGFPVTNRLDERQWLMSADLDEVSGVEVLGIWIVDPVVADDSTDANTTWTDAYPPNAGSFADWDSRQEVDGVGLDGHRTTWVAIALALQPGATQGAASGIRLTYGNDPDRDAIGAVTGGDIRIGIGPEGDDGVVTC